MKKRKLSVAVRLKISKAQQGKNNSMYGKRHTKNSLAKIKRASSGQNNPMFGKTHSAEARRKISIAIRKRLALRKTGK